MTAVKAAERAAGRKAGGRISDRRADYGSGFWLALLSAALLLIALLLAVLTGGALLAEAPRVSVPGGIKAFPGAVGYGASSVGGRGGKILYVTTLADSGPGSYRACVEASGPRVCVFRVNGVIRFTGRPPWIVNPYITIAGETAPGGGITLAHSGGPNGLTPLVMKNTHDVVVRFLRIRTDLPGQNQGSEDNVTIEKSSRIIIDHISTSWARDELISGYDRNDWITISNSIFSWGTPPHDKCALLSSHPVDKQHVTFFHNLCAHNGDRNPDANFVPGSCIEVVNNVLYNAQSEFVEVFETWGGTPISIVGNSIIAGSNTNTNSRGIARQIVGSTGMARIYLWDNEFTGNFKHISPEVEAAEVHQAPCPLTMKPLTAQKAYNSVLSRAGAFPRDAIDVEAVNDVKLRSGRINSPAPAMPLQTAATPYPDADHDGMDDNWERANGLDPTRNDAWADRNGDGVSNFEEFMGYREKVLVY